MLMALDFHAVCLLLTWAVKVEQLVLWCMGYRFVILVRLLGGTIYVCGHVACWWTLRGSCFVTGCFVFEFGSVLCCCFGWVGAVVLGWVLGWLLCGRLLGGFGLCLWLELAEFLWRFWFMGRLCLFMALVLMI